MQVDDDVFKDIVRELDLYLEVVKNLLTNKQLDHVATIGSTLVDPKDISSAITLRERWKVSAEIRDRAARLIKFDQKTCLLTFEPSGSDIYNACLSYRHDFGLLTIDEQSRIRNEAVGWLRAWGHTLPQFKA